MGEESLYISIASFLISFLGLIIALLVYRDNRKKTKLMKDQLEVQKRESAGKDEIRTAVANVRRAKREISGIKPFHQDWSDGLLDSQIRESVSDVMHALHDSGQPVTVKVKKKLMRALGKDKVIDSDREDLESFKDYVKGTKVASEDLEPVFDLGLELEPNLGYWRLTVTGCICGILALGNACDELGGTKDLVDLFDVSLIPDLRRAYSSFVSALFNAFKEKQTLRFTNEMKTKEIEEEILKVIDYKNVRDDLLKTSIEFSGRLNNLEKSLLQIP